MTRIVEGITKALHLNGNGGGKTSTSDPVKELKDGLKVNGNDGKDGKELGVEERYHPQETYSSTTIDLDSFYGKLRHLYSTQVLKTQLEQLKKQGSYDAFKMGWHEVYKVRPLRAARSRMDGCPPSLFWESDIGKWIEGACYFLSSPESANSPHVEEFNNSIQELVDMIEKAQQPDGYLNIYFTVVDPEGRFKNLRDFHEMYNAGHMLEAALAHHQYTGSRQFLDAMIKNIDCFIRTFGPSPSQLHGYPGHPELELAVLRLYSFTKDPKHLEFAKYLLEARGVKREDQNGKTYFVYEAEKRSDPVHPMTMPSLEEQSYNQSHLPLHEQDAILGHSVRAFYLLTAAADIGGEFTKDARRLWNDAIKNKMYITGGFGTEPSIEGFSPIPHHLPQSTAEGGCYAETCASIACMMTSERLLSHGLDGSVRDVMELCFLNAVLGGGSLDGKSFAYANKLATWGDETAVRKEWFEVCCCPPNLSRTLGMLGGYTWTSTVDSAEKVINLDVYLFVSATKTIELPSGTATVSMTTSMPWKGESAWKFEAPEGWKWNVRLPKPAYAEDIKTSASGKETTSAPGFLSYSLPSSSNLTMSFSLPVRLIAPHPATGQDVLTVSRGPIIYVAESVDNPIDESHPHFEGVGIVQNATFKEEETIVEGIPVVAVTMDQHAFVLQQWDEEDGYREVGDSKGKGKARTWKETHEKLKFIPWFARANRGGKGRVRTAFLRVEEGAVVKDVNGYANGN